MNFAKIRMSEVIYPSYQIQCKCKKFVELLAYLSKICNPSCSFLLFYDAALGTDTVGLITPEFIRFPFNLPLDIMLISEQCSQVFLDIL